MGIEAKTSEAAPIEARLSPTLVLAFSRTAPGGIRRLRLTSAGLVLGRDSLHFEELARDEYMSPRHAELRLVSGAVLIRDLASEHGTRLNGQPLVGERTLTPGDVLRLGETLFIYSLTDLGAAGSGTELVGSSRAMMEVQRSVAAVAARKHTVVISGETGTGKEVVARLLHERSRREGPFIAVNCGTFTEGLLASDLFGHVRGAFTGAVAEQQGLFRAASGGTLLLDEVAEIPLALQANLLRVLEMREVRPVGGTRHVPTDVRVLATSNRELIERVQAGQFRADLYSRLAQWTIRLPTLRERREDIPALTTHLLARCDGEGRVVSPELGEALLLHDWPLNVRGLFTVLSVAVVSSPGNAPLALGPEVQSILWTTRSIGVPAAKREAVTLDKEELTALLERFQGKMAALARHLDVTRPKLYRMLWAHDLEPASFR